MENSFLNRYEIENLANCQLPSMLYKAQNGSLRFDFNCLGVTYVVDYIKNTYNQWELSQYFIRELDMAGE
jgi:hypothetical protein